MLPYTVIKEANPPEVSGTTAGVIGFLNLSFTSLLIPAFGWMLGWASAGASEWTLDHYQIGFQPLLYGVVIAIVLSLLLKETGPRRARLQPAVAASEQ